MIRLPHVSYEMQGPVMTIQYDWEEGKNAMDWRALDSMDKIYHIAMENEELKLIVLKGSHGYFNTGGHVDTTDPADKDKYDDALSRSAEAKKNLKVPVLAAVNGDCLAGGMMFLGEADFAVAVDTAKFSFPEILHGAFPIVVMIPIIDVIPRKRAMDVFCTGREFDAQEAYDMGLLTRVVPAEKFDETVQYYIDVVCGIDKNVMQVGRECYYEMLSLPQGDRSACGKRALRAVWEAKEAAKRKTAGQ